MPRLTNLQLEEHRERQMAEARAKRVGEWTWNGKCSKRCSLNPVNTGHLAVLVQEMYNEGESDRAIAKRLNGMEYSISHTSVRMHRENHLYMASWHDAKAQRAEEAAAAATSPQVDEPTEPVENIAALRRIIAVGMKRISSGRISPELVVKAIDLEERLTRGTKTSALMDAIAGAFEDEPDEEEGEESPMQKAARLSAVDDGG